MEGNSSHGGFLCLAHKKTEEDRIITTNLISVGHFLNLVSVQLVRLFAPPPPDLLTLLGISHRTGAHLAPASVLAISSPSHTNLRPPSTSRVLCVSQGKVGRSSPRKY